MNREPKISVIMSVFNGSKFLEADDDEIIEENLSKFAPKIVDGVQQIINFTKKYK